jgi:hypothetical protein
MLQHAIYVRPRPKAIWQLVATSASAEIAKKDKETTLKDAKKRNPEAEARIITYQTRWNIPETLREAKDDGTQLYN